MAELRDKVVVITGASSGLGRAAAIEFVRRGSLVVLAARRGDALEETASLCRRAGGRAVPVVMDVTKPEDVARLVEIAMAQDGGIDVWVNNAGVTLFGPLEEGTFEDHRRVIETNLYGAIHCARAIVPIFQKRGRGVLINVGSILSKIGQPFVPSYVISKFALRGLTETLRMELADEPDVHVCTLLPYAIDTQHFEEGANRVRLQAHAMPPVQTPEKVARALVDLAEHPRRERHVPRVAALGLAMHALLPRTVERVALDVLSQWHFAERGQRSTRGNLYAPRKGKARVHGSRPPRIGLPGLLAWMIGRGLGMPARRRARERHG